MYDPERLHDDIDKVQKSGYFDPEWYREKYKDVRIVGMDPAEHYVKYGAPMQRDPSAEFSGEFYARTYPVVIRDNINPVLHHLKRKGMNAKIEPPQKVVLGAAFNISLTQSTLKGIELAERYLTEDLKYTTEILKANHATRLGQEDMWLKSLNAYLLNYDIEPVTLEAEGPSLLHRLSTSPLAPVNADGPLVTIIMPAWNAENTVLLAARSILKQTWRAIELIIVNDASTDGTWDILKKIQQEDKRVKIINNSVNSGPYVSKNIALLQAKGDYITGHDADDWAHPQRIENHLKAAVLGPTKLRASVTYMLRMQPDGFFGFIGPINGFSTDGATRRASISCLFERKLLIEQLGFWDTVRFGADSEMIGRTETILGKEFGFLPQIGMICLDQEGSLTNHPDFGVDRVKGMSSIRRNYRDSWHSLHTQNQASQNLYLPFIQETYRYDAPESMRVPIEGIRTFQAGLGITTLP